MSKVRIAIVGVGNCAAALVQGLSFYRDAHPDERVPGLMHVRLGPYHVSDIEVVAAFDVDGKKVGRDVAEAIFTEPNNTIRFVDDIAPTGVLVQRGPTLDGLGQYYREEIQESDEQPVDVAAALRESGADVMVSYLPVGGTSHSLMVLFSLATSASDRSRPTFLPSTSNAATNSMSRTW